MKKVWTIFLSIGTSIIGLISFFWGSKYVVPDLTQVEYGFPLVWGTNVVNSIAGPVDLWYINFNSLVIDLIFWFAVVIIVTSLSLYRE
ncbi:hypothetical protein JW865_07140 [Candidatus Bathyarchaeota archaeon]|nr:hypothetical protein [Candidatus Bathyarchaeota archaeon]